MAKQPGIRKFNNIVLKRGVFKATKAQFLLKKPLVKSLVKVV
jgi:hypothetical protein